MKIRNIVISMLTALCLLTTYASAASSKPEKCPSPAAVMQAGYEVVTKHGQTTPSAYEIYNHENNYGTADKWTLFAVNLASSDTEAVQKLNKRLSSLSVLEGPGKQHSDDMWVCGYANEHDPDNFEVIYTITPPVSMSDAIRLK